jgi:hypothetical protein
LFAALPVAPVWVGLAIAAALLGLLLVTSAASGDLAALAAEGVPWWRNRDGRLAVLLCILGGFLPAALRYQELGTAQRLRELASSFGWSATERDGIARGFDEGGSRGALRAGAVGLLLAPLVALLVDRDPTLYLRGDYWRAVNLWTWGLGGFVCAVGGVLVHRVRSDGLHFSALGRDLREIDLLDLGRLAPFARQGLRASLTAIVCLSVFAFNLVDPGFRTVVALIAAVTLPAAAGALLGPVVGVRARIAREKREELARVNAAIRGDRATLRSCAVASDPVPGLADLLAYRQFVESVPEWPFDTSMRARIGLYLVIPIGSWIGGALVERVLNALLGSG